MHAPASVPHQVRAVAALADDDPGSLPGLRRPGERLRRALRRRPRLVRRHRAVRDSGLDRRGAGSQRDLHRVCPALGGPARRLLGDEREHQHLPRALPAFRLPDLVVRRRPGSRASSGRSPGSSWDSRPRTTSCSSTARECRSGGTSRPTARADRRQAALGRQRGLRRVDRRQLQRRPDAQVPDPAARRLAGAQRCRRSARRPTSTSCRSCPEATTCCSPTSRATTSTSAPSASPSDATVARRRDPGDHARAARWCGRGTARTTSRWPRPAGGGNINGSTDAAGRARRLRHRAHQRGRARRQRAADLAAPHRRDLPHQQRGRARRVEARRDDDAPEPHRVERRTRRPSAASTTCAGWPTEPSRSTTTDPADARRASSAIAINPGAKTATLVESLTDSDIPSSALLRQRAQARLGRLAGRLGRQRRRSPSTPRTPHGSSSSGSPSRRERYRAFPVPTGRISAAALRLGHGREVPALRRAGALSARMRPTLASEPRTSTVP